MGKILRSIALLICLIGKLDAKPMVVTTFSILKDWVEVLAHDLLEVKNIVGPNQDAHIFEAKPQHIRDILKSHMVIAYGLGFEDAWLNRIRDSKPNKLKKKIIYVTKGVDPIRYYDPVIKREMSDPHGWHDLRIVEKNLMELAEGIKSLLPVEKHRLIDSRLQRYIEYLKTMDTDLKKQIEPISPQKRIIVTSHDGFGYFARAYNIRIISLQGQSTESQPSASAVANLIRIIKSEGVKSVFLENIINPKLMQQIAKETGVKLKGPLYSDALSRKDEPAYSFIKMFKHNSQLFIESMSY
jgi:zinc/manganese transport system substrate-binding protein